MQQQTTNKNKQKLHHFQNCTARSILRAPRSEHVNTLSQKHHWLLIPACIVYIFHCLAFSAVSVDTRSCPSDFYFLFFYLQQCTRYFHVEEGTFILSVPEFNYKTEDSCTSSCLIDTIPPDIAGKKGSNYFLILQFNNCLP